MFGGSDEAVLARGAAGACGLLINETLTFLRYFKIAELPTQQQLARLVGANAGTFGHFLNGAPSSGRPWIEHAQRCLRQLVCGDSTTSDPCFGRINDYFFREFNPSIRDGVPPFFRVERARFGEPYTLTELAGEIEWYAVERERTQRDAKLVWVSGHRTILADGSAGALGQSLRRAVDAGVTTQFAVHGTATPAFVGLDELFNTASSPAPNLSRVDVSTLSTATNGWWEFLNPVLQYLYMKIDGDNSSRAEEVLYIVRAPEQDTQRYGPIALEANTLELAAFRAWMQRLGL
jgi:hypothetical protein